MSGLYMRPPESHRFTFVGRDAFKSMLLSFYMRPPESHRFTFVGRDAFESMLRRSESSSHSMLLTCNGPVQDPFPPRLLHKSSARNNYNIIISLRDVNSSASQARVLLTSCTPRTPFSVSSGCDETLLPGMLMERSFRLQKSLS